MPVKQSRFSYPKMTADMLSEAKNLRGGGFDSWIKREFKRYKMREGQNKVRFLPPTWGSKDEPVRHFAYPVYLVRNVGPDKQTYLSLSQMGKGRDPLDDARRTSPALAKALTPSLRFLAWVIDRNAEEDGPQLMDFPQKLNKPICTKSRDGDTGAIISIYDLEEGADVRFVKEGTALNTDYPGEEVRLVAKTPYLSDDGALVNEWMEYVQAHPVPTCLEFYDYEHIAAVFGGSIDSSTSEAAEDPVEVNTTRSSVPWNDSVDTKGSEETLSISERLRRRRSAEDDA